MSSIFNGQINQNTSKDRKQAYQKHLDDELRSKNNYHTLYKPINVSKMLKDQVLLSNGQIKEIHPAEIADIVKQMMDEMMRNPKYSFIKPYIQKPVIWTYTPKTACTDGIRIYMSPLFADLMLGDHFGNKEANEYFSKLSASEYLDPTKRANARSIRTKYIRFIIVHEVFHILYNHTRRGILKYGSNPTITEHDNANVAMDLEINRDIESMFPDLEGSTKVIGGVWYLDEKMKGQNIRNRKGEPFKKDIWEDIWDVFMERGNEFNLDDMLGNEGADPTQQDARKQGPYADGWRKAVESIKGKLIDPKTFNLPESNTQFSDEEFKDFIDKLVNSAPEDED